MRFLGNIEAKTDTKGRVFLPVAFRKVLTGIGETNIVMRKDVFQKCLVLYPENVWNSQMDSLREKLNRWDKNEQTLFRQFVSQAEIITLDANGRFLIPKKYMQMASIDQTVKFIGMGDTIEIWAAENEEEQFMDTEEFGKALEELLG
ncbi:MAG: division/cell wall cluster transcriptional repressor MraZ [Prevotella sp.]|nr:division/cell wall cluster transcriptional repressor MraZ [Prevotellaceae bacterium]MDY5006177.1 division/cell wall cluster transcriptional repressor MraZ [Prevotella sp.]MDY5249323.1 division/cell wall cluster transcriptional repressor MraZ [Prevotella sp.]